MLLPILFEINTSGVIQFREKGIRLGVRLITQINFQMAQRLGKFRLIYLQFTFFIS